MGKAPFFGLTFKVTPATLVPRPATETLVEFVLETEKARRRDDPRPEGHGLRLCDIGTGSGTIALALAKFLPAEAQAKIVASSYLDEHEIMRLKAAGAKIDVWGVGMRLVLYDAAFAALVQIVPSRGRHAISYLTLFGAFASTIFWVVGYFLNEAVGWRQTVVLFAAINLAVCLPLHWYGLARREAARSSRK